MSDAKYDDLIQQLKQRDDELQLISHEIHDGLLQFFIAAKMTHEAFRLRLEREGAAVPEEVQQVGEYLQEGIEAGRRMIDHLWPVDFGSVTLRDALTSALERFSRTGAENAFNVSLKADPQLEARDQFMKLMLYRIIQQAVANAWRHSKADRVAVTLNVDPEERLIVEIQDNGCGFDPESIDDSRFGLRAIRQRARMIGGQTECKTGPDGTTIRIEIAPDGGETK